MRWSFRLGLVLSLHRHACVSLDVQELSFNHERPLWAERPSDYSKSSLEYSIPAKLYVIIETQLYSDVFPTVPGASRGNSQTSVQLSNILLPVQVIKVGTSSLVRPEHNTLNLSSLARLCEVVRELKSQQHRCSCSGCSCTFQAATVVQNGPSAFYTPL